ncbi:chaperonin 10-like protein [Hygrophoropsis aurantiaca]|uniref:Chaperonin 10-like protein n=1 Tax=Hygrophoropsis aurantiaca TaxID=72124 RepID=A0ACB8AK66_9AGAM|nr:chaperonin 10-like protein [Hygrophoropsis aurantiaca]
MSTNQTQQKALFLQTKQGNLIVGDRIIPHPGQGELLIQVCAAGLNPVDYKIKEHGVFIKDYPAILGSDASGVVEEVGQGVQDFSKGDRVFTHGFYTNDKATFQQHTLATASFTDKIPSKLSFDEAASVPLGFDTAVTGLYGKSNGAGITPPWEGGNYDGKPIIIMGGSGSVGNYAIQLARLSGFSKIITTASPSHTATAYLKSLGATDVLDRHLSSDQLEDAVRKIAGSPVKVIYDTVSLPGTQRAAWNILAPDGTLVLTLPSQVKETEGKQRKVVTTFGNPHNNENKDLAIGAWHSLEGWLENGQIKPNKIEVLGHGLEGIKGGLERMSRGQVSGVKLIAHPQESV